MRGLLGGIATGALVSALGLGTLSVMSTPPMQMAANSAAEPTAQAAATPVADTPAADALDAGDEDDAAEAETAAANSLSDASSPVGAVTIDAPLTPDLPEQEALAVDTGSSPQAPATPEVATPDTATQLADTGPSQQPEALSLYGTLNAPDAPEGADVTLEMDAPVLPNPQSLPPQTPVNETDLVLSTDPAQPVTTVSEPEAAAAASVAQETATMVLPADEVFVVDLGDQEPANKPEGQREAEVAAPAMPQTEQAANQETRSTVAQDATPQDNADDDVLASSYVEPVAPRVQLQGGQNSLLEDRGTGVTVRRPTGETVPESAAPRVAALTQYAAQTPDTGGAPFMSIVLIDDGSMSAAAAALAGLPFPVTIAIDPADAAAAGRMAAYRADGFEVAVLARIPEGALPSDVEVTLGSVFDTLPETIAVLDIGTGGLQQDAAVTEQAMDILAADGRGFVTAAQGLNMASRAAEQAGVPAAVIYRDLDADGQEARVIRRFIDQAAFEARRESGVVLVGRVRPDTISALILWGAANQNAQVAIVPVSTVLNGQ